MDRDSAAQRLVDYLLRPQRYAESEDSGRQTYIGAIGDDGVAKVISDKVGKWSKTYFNQANNHGSLGWRNPDKPMIKFRACDGICYWWDQPTEEHKEEANQAVVKAGGQPIQTHVFISPNEAKSWIDRLIDKEKAKSDVEYSWQRAHYESISSNYNTVQKFIITQWGSLLYLGYGSLPRGTGNISRLGKLAADYFVLKQRGDDVAIEEFDEWVESGMPEGGSPILTRDLVDQILVSCQVPLKGDTTVYKSGPIRGRWVSASLVKGGYSHLGGEQAIALRSGTPIIFTDGLADNDEVILDGVMTQHYESTREGLQSELDQLASEFKDRLYVRFDIHDGNIHLYDVHAKIGLPPGTGSAFMQRLSVIADKYDSTVTLETADKGHQHSKEYKKTSSRPRLKSFYGRFGFKSNYGARSYRSDLPGNMHRIPKTVSKP